MSDSAEIKIRIPLVGMERSANLQYERIWADPRGDDLYQVWNLPAYAYNIEMADVVRCRKSSDQELDVIEVVEKSGSVGVWLYFSSDCTIDDVSHAILEITNAGDRRPTFEKFADGFWGVSFRDQQHFKEVLPIMNTLLGTMNVKHELVAQPDKPFWRSTQ